MNSHVVRIRGLRVVARPFVAEPLASIDSWRDEVEREANGSFSVPIIGMIDSVIREECTGVLNAVVARFLAEASLPGGARASARLAPAGVGTASEPRWRHEIEPIVVSDPLSHLALQMDGVVLAHAYVACEWQVAREPFASRITSEWPAKSA